ncbi:MAG: ABC transporter substrate-binding protein, partial [Candidatus Hermodarchaeota archaeon]
MNKMRSITLLMLLLASMVLPWFVVTPTVTSVQAQAEDPIKIGVFAPFTTAGLSFYAPWTKQGFELGMIYATTEMGYDNENKTEAGRPYEIIYYDTKGSVTEAASLVTSAIETDGIDIIVGGTYSSVAAAIAPIAEEYKKLYFITPAADASLTAANFNPYIFRIARNNWHDAYAGVTYAIDTLGHTKFGFLAADYSFGYSGVDSMKTVIQEKGGVVNSIQYAPLGTSDFGPYLTNLLTADANPLLGIDYLFVVWAGSFAAMYSDFGTYDIASYMEIAGACIDILSMNIIEAGMTPPATYVGATGLCLYGYELPDNDVNDWMVAEHVSRNIKPNGAFALNYRVPELFTASGFATAQFLVNVTNAVPDLNINAMIDHLESGLTIDCPKGPTYLRPEDHQGLAEMYIAEAWLDDRPTSETNGFIIANLVETLDRDVVAPPIAAMWNDEPYVPGGFATTATTPAFDTVTVIFGFVTVSIIALFSI